LANKTDIFETVQDGTSGTIVY